MTHEMRVLSAKGHTTVAWDTEKPETVDEVKAEFDKLIAANYKPFNTDVKPGEPMGAFDETVSTMVMVPPMAGGAR